MRRLTAKSRNEPTPEANGYGVGSAARLKLRQQMADVRFDRLLREEEALPDLAVDEAVGDELQDLDLTRSRILSELTLDLGRKGDDRAMPACASTRGGRLEAAAVVSISVEDLLTLCGVHDWGIGTPLVALKAEPRSLTRTGEPGCAKAVIRLPVGWWVPFRRLGRRTGGKGFL